MRIRQYTLGLFIIYALFSLLWLLSNKVQYPLLQEVFVDSYWMLPITGGIIGLVAAKTWGLGRNFLGCGLLFFALYLLLQGLGQLGYTIEAHYLGIVLTFPSYIEIFFLASLLCLLIGTCFFIMTFFIQIDQPNLHSRKALFTCSVVCGALLGFFLAFFVFRQVGVLDRGLIIGSLYIITDSILILVFLIMVPLSLPIHYARFVGNICLFLAAFACQCLADLVFILEVSKGEWEIGTISDLLYLTSYFLFGISIVRLGLKFYRDYNHPILVLFSYTSILSCYLILVLITLMTL